MINCTPHSVVVINGPTFPASGFVARAIAAEQAALPTIEGCPIVEPPRFEGCDGLPPDEGQAILVSIVAAPAVVAAGWSGQVLVPDTGPGSAVRGPEGAIVGVRRLILWRP